MASTDWMEIYRSYSATDLAAEIVELRKQATHFTSQSIGNKSYAKDLTAVKDRLHAAVRVTNERSARGRSSSRAYGVFDFSGFRF